MQTILVIMVALSVTMYTGVGLCYAYIGFCKLGDWWEDRYFERWSNS